MLRAGDELGQSQKGNNNPYCQDNELSWLNWELNDEQRKFLGFVRRVTKLWKEQPVFHHRHFYQGRSIRGSDIKDLSWFEPNGQEMSDAAWNDGNVRCLGVRLAGDFIDDVDDHGEPIVGDTLLLLFNAHIDVIPFLLPTSRDEDHWETLVDTANLLAEVVAERFHHRVFEQPGKLRLLPGLDQLGDISYRNVTLGGVGQ